MNEKIQINNAYMNKTKYYLCTLGSIHCNSALKPSLSTQVNNNHVLNSSSGTHLPCPEIAIRSYCLLLSFLWVTSRF